MDKGERRVYQSNVRYPSRWARLDNFHIRPCAHIRSAISQASAPRLNGLAARRRARRRSQQNVGVRTAQDECKRICARLPNGLQRGDVDGPNRASDVLCCESVYSTPSSASRVVDGVRIVHRRIVHRRDGTDVDRDGRSGRSGGAGLDEERDGHADEPHQDGEEDRERDPAPPGLHMSAARAFATGRTTGPPAPG